GFAVLAAPLAGLVFLLPIFGSSAGHMAAAADPAAAVATVNGAKITNGELQAEIDTMMSLSGAPQLGTATEPGAEAPVGTEGMTEEQVSITALNQLVQTSLIEQGAAEMGITVTDADVETRKQALIASDSAAARHSTRSSRPRTPPRTTPTRRSSRCWSRSGCTTPSPRAR
nr:SurA N-terminal domain-containing protein [Geodermatophilaceae bacterium]